MTRKIIMAFWVHVLFFGVNATTYAEDRPPVPPPTSHVNPDFQQSPPSFPPTAPPASITPVETLNGLPLKNAPTSGTQSTTGTQSIKQLQVKPKQKQMKPEMKAVDSKKANPSAEAQHQITPVHKMAPLPPTRKKVKNPVTPEQK